MNATVDTKAIDLAAAAGEIGSDAIGGSVRAVSDLSAGGSRSTAELLKELRRAFPDMPLAERVAALTTIARF